MKWTLWYSGDQACPLPRIRVWPPCVFTWLAPKHCISDILVSSLDSDKTYLHQCNSNIFNCCSLRLKQRHTVSGPRWWIRIAYDHRAFSHASIRILCCWIRNSNQFGIHSVNQCICCSSTPGGKMPSKQCIGVFIFMDVKCVWKVEGKLQKSL